MMTLFLERTYYMKKGTILGIVLAVAALILLGLLAVYLTLQNQDEVFSSGPTAVESEAEAVLQSLVEPAREPSENTEASSEAASSQEDLFLIWAGDSRTLGMRDAVDNDDVYIGASGEGYRWLSETGLSQIRDAIRTYPDAPVVFNFGVNDYDSMEDYLELYQSLAEEYPDTHFYFLSVNPIEPTLCKNITNEEIADFNSHLQEAFPDTYIDSFTYLMVTETTTIDGIHYSQDDYRAIYEFAVQKIQSIEEDWE